MVGVVPIRVVSILLLGTCGALCQQRGGQGRAEWPDAPSALITNSLMFQNPANTAPSNPSNLGSESRPARADFGVAYNAEPEQKRSEDFFEKYLYPTMLKRNLSYHPSSSSSLVGRATYAASRLFVSRDETGRGRLNTSYFVAVLSSAVARSAYRPYWRRSVSGPFSEFGSTIGNDAGMNLFHEFGPGLEQMMKNHTPRFVSKIEERIGR